MQKSTKYLIIGAGIHGLSSAYHLAKELKKNNKGSGEDILIIDKKTVGSGASGIACGVVRNNYSQTSMRKLMQHSVSVWEEDPASYNYHSVGYMQINTAFMTENVSRIAQEQKSIGYDSTFIQGKQDCDKYMKNLFSDWKAQEIDSILHEKKGGFANNMLSLQGLAKKAKNEGVEILENTKVLEFKRSSTSEQINSVITDKGEISCEFVILAAGPWAGHFWDLLSLPKTIKVNSDSNSKDVNMWTYWCLQEGTLGIPPDNFKTNDGKTPPVIHVDSDIPLYSVRDPKKLCSEVWGIYYKPDFCFKGLQGGAMPYIIDKNPEEVLVDPYGTASPEYTVKESFVELWLAALAHCHSRFEDVYDLYKKEPSGGIGAFTPDNFPIFDTFFNNCYIIADSNHGYKMLGVGKLVAEEIINQQPSDLLEPFRFSRYNAGKIIPTSNSPFPWS